MIRAKFLQTIFIAKRPPKNGWGGEFAVITACNPLTGGDRDADVVETAKLRGFRFGLGGGFRESERRLVYSVGKMFYIL